MYITGIKADRVRTAAEGPEYALGTLGAEMTSVGPKIYMYVTTTTGITGAGYVCLVHPTLYSATMASVSSTAPGSGQGRQAALGVAAVAANGYGWVQVFGQCSVRVAANCAGYTQLNSTASTGVIDDDATASSEVMEGIVTTASPGGAEGTVVGYANWPRAGRTLP